MDDVKSVGHTAHAQKETELRSISTIDRRECAEHGHDMAATRRLAKVSSGAFRLASSTM